MKDPDRTTAVGRARRARVPIVEQLSYLSTFAECPRPGKIPRQIGARAVKAATSTSRIHARDRVVVKAGSKKKALASRGPKEDG
jgi:hypothetical protein